MFYNNGFEDYHLPPWAIPKLTQQQADQLYDNFQKLWNNQLKFNQMEVKTAGCVAQSRFSELSSQVVDFLINEPSAVRNDFMHEISETVQNNLRERYDIALTGQQTAQGEVEQFEKTLESIRGVVKS